MANEVGVKDIIHNVHSITISDYSKFEELNDIKFLLIDRNTEINEEVSNLAKEFISQVSEYFQPKEVKKNISAKENIARKELDIQLLSLILDSLKWGGSEFTREQFFKRYRHQFSNDKDLQKLERDIEKNKLRVKEMKQKLESKSENVDSKTISSMIVDIEEFLSVKIDRTYELYTLKAYIDRAVDKAAKINSENN